MKSKPKEEKWMFDPEGYPAPCICWMVPEKDGPEKALVRLFCNITENSIVITVRRSRKCRYVSVLKTKPNVSVADAELERRKYFGFRFKTELKLLE